LLYPVNTITEFYDIEIYFKNSFFASSEFDEYGEIGFNRFPDNGTPWPQKEIFGCLL